MGETAVRVEEVAVPQAMRMAGSTRWFRVGPCSVAAGREFLAGEPRYHMSVAHPRRLPTWDEIKEAKQAMHTLGVLESDRTYVMPFPPRRSWLSVHPYCFHLWELLNSEIAADWAREGEAAAPWRTLR